MKNDLEKFVAKQIEELSEELVCPVCLEVTTKPGGFGVLNFQILSSIPCLGPQKAA